MSSFQIDLNERGFTTDSKSPFLLETKVVKLYDYHDVPYFLRGNPYITSGYRAFLSVRMCMKRLEILLDICDFLFFLLFRLIVFISEKIVERLGAVLSDVAAIVSLMLIGLEILPLFFYVCHRYAILLLSDRKILKR